MFRKYEKTFRILVPQYPGVKGKHYLPTKEVKELLRGRCVITEKMDGANIGIIGTKQGFKMQKRGSLVDISEHAQFGRFKAWANEKYDVLSHIPNKWILYGELMHTVHSVYYDKLPDWVLIFGIWDGKEYMEWEEVEEYCSDNGLYTVPHLFTSSGWDRNTIVDDCMPDDSFYGSEEAEGIVIYNYKRQQRAKVVKEEFVKGIGKHWTSNAVKINKIITKEQLENIEHAYDQDSYDV